jgi:Ca2+-binding RTX toxin-like protein
LDGDDVLDGGTGADTMTGGKGNDTYMIDNAGDVIVETGASLADWAISALSIDLTKGAFNGIEHAGLTGSANLFVTGDSNSNWIIGNNGNNQLVGNQGDDSIQGGAGNDTLNGGTGADNLNGGSGNDIYWVDNANDKVSEIATDSGDAGGIDTVNSSVDFILGNYVENLTLTGSAYSAIGNALDNILIGNSDSNWLSGLGGADKMIGGGGSDHYAVDNAQDQVIEAANGGQTDGVFSSISYTLTANVESLFLVGNQDIDGNGNAGRNYIRGNDGDNLLDGGGGNDVMIGQGGNDTINVSQGNDTVQYWSELDGYDIIQGFDGNATGGQDVFNLDSYFDSLKVDIWDRAERVGITDNGTSVDIWLDTNGDGFLNAKIATLQTADAVTVGADIQVI